MYHVVIIIIIDFDFDFDFDDEDDEAPRGGVAFARAFVAFVGGDCVVVVVARARGSRLSVCSRHRAEYEVTLASSSSSSSS